MEGDVGSVNTKYHQYACCSFDRIIQFQTRVICQASILSSFVLIHINFYTYIALEITLQRRRSILILVKAMNLPFQLNKCIKSIKCHLHTLKAYLQESCYANIHIGISRITTIFQHWLSMTKRIFIEYSHKYNCWPTHCKTATSSFDMLWCPLLYGNLIFETGFTLCYKVFP